jgi:hypothetical protein
MFLSFLFPISIISFARVIKPEPIVHAERVIAPSRKKKKVAKTIMQKTAGANIEQAIAQATV